MTRQNRFPKVSKSLYSNMRMTHSQLDKNKKKNCPIPLTRFRSYVSDPVIRTMCLVFFDMIYFIIITHVCNRPRACSIILQQDNIYCILLLYVYIPHIIILPFEVLSTTCNCTTTATRPCGFCYFYFFLRVLSLCLNVRVLRLGLAAPSLLKRIHNIIC